MDKSQLQCGSGWWLLETDPVLSPQLLKYTPEGHPDHQNTEEALTAAHTLCSQVGVGLAAPPASLVIHKDAFSMVHGFSLVPAPLYEITLLHFVV